MSPVHVFTTQTDPYPSQQTRNPTRTRNSPKFWPVPGPDHKNVVSILPHDKALLELFCLKLNNWLKWSHYKFRMYVVVSNDWVKWCAYCNTFLL